MEKLQSLSFKQNEIKYITVEKNNNCWVLLNHGIVLLQEEGRFEEIIQWTKKNKDLFKNNRFKKNHGFITIEPHHTYLNYKKIPTLEKFNPQSIIYNNYKNTIPVLFEKNCYGLDYAASYIESLGTTEISFMGMLQEKIDFFYQACLNMNINPLALNPSYQYFTAFLKKQSDNDKIVEYAVYTESSKDLLTFVLIHNNNPIIKRSIEINSHLEINTNNYFYYLKHYLMLPDIFVFFSKIDHKVEALVRKILKSYYFPSSQKVIDFISEHPSFKNINIELMHEYQDCFIALGGMDIDESAKRKN